MPSRSSTTIVPVRLWSACAILLLSLSLATFLSAKEDRPKTARHYDDMDEDMALDDYEHHRPASRSSFGSL
ncbi:hypothetical protein G6F57_020123 [Rhizopus arrhizus]|uniref:Uncharacterized protein n=1 Tax=Rhizopus oryzae TaxID=64495 RepID=A0A9P6WTS6_RHIOR|nr:hypothetical protein G6F23_014267 [Rhizopus arrhizus]KAG0922981.1 hypothetical protein G6F30_013975 [Rhizopus arrhizus]KAG1016832.1 hypothetical protein G6F25_014018 [Rhizopus arrhizus]KAG1080942.1 hypothetical protein G6F39_014009 [Rhizopus arrhizus]KAG1165610.1 hypothetical protein G6F35_018686 [Rhizopus arrhizus]